MYSPRYHLERSVLLDLAWAGLTGGRRDFREHARSLLPGMLPPLEVLGKEHVPTAGPGVILINHYSRPGFFAGWLGIAISALTPVEVCWTVTSAWTFPGHPLRRWLRPLSAAFISRLVRVYGFLPMPPMAPGPKNAAERGVAVRRVLQYARAHPDRLLGLAPEGSDTPGGRLSLPPEGAGRLALALGRGGRPFYPVGAFETGGRFTLRFGLPFRLAVDENLPKEQVDEQARWQLARALADCLPESLRGQAAGG